MLPTEQRAKDLWENTAALLFADFWQTKDVEDKFERLGKLLGLIWKRDEVEAAQENRRHVSRRAPDEIFIPLSMILEPSIGEQVGKLMGNNLGIHPPEWAKSEDLENTYDMGQEEFLNFVGSVIRPKILRK